MSQSIVRASALSGALVILGLSTLGANAQVVTFDELTFASGHYWNGSDGSGGFDSQGVHFKNLYDTQYGSWSGFAYSEVNNPTNGSWGNQYAVASGTDYGGAGKYAVGYYDTMAGPSAITFSSPAQVHGFYVNNTTYGALTVQNGGMFSKKFGGASGTDPDWFKLTISAKDAAQQSLGSLDFYLADFRDANPALHTIIQSWTYVDLSGFGGGVKELNFTMSSSDTGDWGMNTPAYFAIDNLSFASVPEPGTGTILALGGLAAWLWRRKTAGRP